MVNCFKFVFPIFHWCHEFLLDYLNHLLEVNITFIIRQFLKLFIWYRWWTIFCLLLLGLIFISEWPIVIHLTNFAWVNVFLIHEDILILGHLLLTKLVKSIWVVVIVEHFFCISLFKIFKIWIFLLDF